IATCIDRLLLLERVAPRQARIRLAGQRVTSQLGMDLRGMPLLALLAPQSRDWLADITETLFDTPARIELGLAGPATRLRARNRASMLLLP
ncbi:PAS domain-containing protein, partial [Escherichia coli]|nr:PAS domain-containing protein [Escherichia coli]